MWADPDIETVRPGVHRIPLPLVNHPGLRAVNVYVLEDESGLTLIDSGTEDPAGQDALKRGLTQLGHTIADIRQIIVTHCHADHVGQATLVRRNSGAKVVIGAAERKSFELMAYEPELFPVIREGWMRTCGAFELIEQISSDPAMRAKHFDWDRPSGWISDGDRLTYGRGELEAYATPGHTRGHFAFLARDRKLLFPGDHVLPHISPSIGFESDRSPTALGDFLKSLARVRDLPVDVILPAHGPVFTDLAGRVDELTEHHRLRLAECVAAVSESGSTAFEVATRLGWTRRRLSYDTLRTSDRVLAVWETGAHLELLESQGLLTKRPDGSADRYLNVAVSTTKL